MASIQTGIELNDQFSGVLMGIINSVNLAVSSMEAMNQAMQTDIDTASIQEAREQIDQATVAARELSRAFADMASPDVNAATAHRTADTPPQNNSFNNMRMPVEPMETDGSAEQRIGNITNRLQQVTQMQAAINDVGRNCYVLPDDVTEPVQAMNREIRQMQAALDFINSNPFDLDSSIVELQIERINSDLDDLIEQQQRVNSLMGNMPSQIADARPDIETPQSAPTSETVLQPQPVQWQSDTMQVFSGTGAERFEQEIRSANAMLETLNARQQQIQQTAEGMDILPDNAIREIAGLGNRIQAIIQRIQEIENNPVNLGGVDAANAELEQLRGQLSQAITQQENFSQAMQGMDASAANSAYLQLSQTVRSTEAYIRDNVNEQGAFNSAINEGTQKANSLIGEIKGMAAAYISMRGVGKTINLSDTMTQATARLDLIVDDGGSVEELQNKIYVSAENARSSYLDVTQSISKLGLLAGDAFGSNDELIKFVELMNKNFIIGGSSASEQTNAMYQLNQAMASGRLQGDEYRSIIENAPLLANSIENYMRNVQGAKGEMKEWASDGLLTADVIKNAMFNTADEVEARFGSMPMTWGQAWTSLKNTAIMAFQPILQRLNEIANSEQFQASTANVINAMAVVAGILLQVFDLIGAVGQFVADNWGVISPIVYGVIAALAAYCVIMGAVKAVQLIAAAGQWVFNAALFACPLTWIIIGIVALIGVVVALASHFSGAGHVAATTFGAICGGVNVAIQFFRNLGVAFANISLGIVEAAKAVGENIMTFFHNAICSVKSWWFGLLSDALTVIDGICEALNKLPFVEFDYSGITGAADDYAKRSAEAAGNKEEYRSVGDAFLDAAQTYDMFGDGWIDAAYQQGAAWGDGISDKIKNAFTSKATDIPQRSDYENTLADSNNLDETAKNTGDTAKSAAKAADTVSITSENLKYLRDIADREYINRFTTARITVNQTNHNKINSELDLDGVTEHLRATVEEQMYASAEGVH